MTLNNTLKRQKNLGSPKWGADVDSLIDVQKEKITFNSWLEPASFVVDKFIKIYRTELSILVPGKTMGFLFAI